MKKYILVLWILIFSLLIFETSQNIWIETKLNSLRNKVREKPFVDDPAMEKLLLKLQRVSPKNAKVWSLTSRYYFKKMTRSFTDEEKIAWIDKAYHASLKALKYNPFDNPSKAFLNKILRWRGVLLSNSPTPSELGHT